MTGLTTKPPRMADAETHTFFTTPSMTQRTFCRFGLNFRRLVPRIFLPTPPRYFALPRYFLRLPKTAFLPVNTHVFAMTVIP